MSDEDEHFEIFALELMGFHFAIKFIVVFQIKMMILTIVAINHGDGARLRGTDMLIIGDITCGIMGVNQKTVGGIGCKKCIKGWLIGVIGKKTILL